VEPVLGTAIARAVHLAERECAARPRRDSRAVIAIKLRPERRPSVRIALRDSEDLVDCMQSAIARAPIPGVIAARDLVFPMYLEWSDERQWARTPKSGAALVAGTRQGALDMYSIGVTGLVDIGYKGGLSWFGNFALEGGVSGNELAYVARGTGGFAFGFASGGMFGLFAGVGMCNLGEEAPRSFEIPVEARARIPIGRKVRGHAWLQLRYMLGDSMRQRDEATWYATADEIALGLGVAIPKAPLFIGGELDSRTSGTDVLIVAGVPFGRYF
jgi:hypothetical protein